MLTKRLAVAAAASAIGLSCVLLGSADAAPGGSKGKPPKPTPTPTATSTPTATATPTVTATPTTTSTSPVGGYPDASNTGVPDGVALTSYSGSLTITTADTVIDSKAVNGCLEIRAPRVVIKRSKITCLGGGVAIANFDENVTNSVTVEDSEISCGNNPGHGLGDARITALRLDISGCENGFDVNQDVTVRDSYIHGLYTGGDAHTDGIQFAYGHFVNGQVVPGSLNVTIEHNRIYANDGTSAIISNRGGDTNVLIRNNLMAGGAATLYCEQNATGINYRVIDNRISTIFYPNGGFYMPWTDCEDEEISGNVWHETGQPLPL